MEIFKPGFKYTVEHIGADGVVKSVEEKLNIMPTVSLNYLIGAALKGTSQFTTWYLGLYDNNYAPLATDTMTTLIASCGENVDYTGTARQTITFPAVSDGGVIISSGDATVNTFAFTTAETIRGAFISTVPTWESTSGLLLSAVLFDTAKSVVSGESLKVPLGFTLTSV